ncbi:hypothetical protein [Undibacterium baiyunense]|uniref:Uncharacterized protein n=1 Tax=Undibacterium baiyunense TaxID=2828731 RepID=A0A941DBR3_9BURK|nr:hypothetical protein [Undibacterium baiyunense]MBR7745330.1 hypothetical protein [Undibacterium baiyunense]
MIFLAITPTGLKNALQVIDTSISAIWCGSDAISEIDYENLKGRNVSRFNYDLGGETRNVINRALETIEEHHPNEIIWIENVSEL